MDYKGLCLGCMCAKGEAVECPKCGYVEGTPQVLPYLTPGTMLHERYIIGKRLSNNGEGVTYIGLDKNTGKRVSVREYLPKTLCSRVKGDDNIVIASGNKLVFQDYLQDFMEIGRAEAKLANLPSIVPVIDVFNENQTGYVISEYVDGKSLSEIVKRARRLTWDEARPLFMPLISSIISAHSIGLVHFGICPDNIIMTRTGTLMLTSFGSPDAHLAETEFTPEFYDGYSAIEQYSLEGKKGKWTDVYALSAVIFFALTGKRPPDAVSRTYEPRLNIPADIAQNIPAHVVTALAGGLQVKPEERIRSMEELKESLNNPVSRVSSANNVSNSRASAPSSNYIPENDSKYVDYDPEPPTRPVRQNAPVNRSQNISRSQTTSRSQTRNNEPDSEISPYKYGLMAGLIGFVVLGVIALILIKFLIMPMMTNSDDDINTTPELYVSSTISNGAEQTVLYEVPNLVNRQWSKVNGNEKYANFDIRLTSEDYSDTVKEGCIISQTVAAGSAVAQHTPIGVVVSLGPKMRTVPNIVGMTVTEAAAELEKAGLSLGDQAEEYSSSYEMGRIIRLNGTKVGNKLQAGSVVNVVVSLGTE